MSDAAAAPRPKTVAVLVMTVLVPFGIGYYMSYLFRTVNAIISPQLVRDVGLTPGDLGLLPNTYFARGSVPSHRCPPCGSDAIRPTWAEKICFTIRSSKL